MKVTTNFSIATAIFATCFCAVSLAWPFDGSNEIDDDDVAECEKVDVAKGEYSYEMKYDWPTLYPDFCAGASQSPINIDVYRTRNQWYPTRLNLSGYAKGRSSSATLENDGHTVVVTSPDVVEISGGAARGNVFRLDSLHFHFGESDDDGTEHRINRGAYAMEIHFVHRNTKYGDMEQAASNPDGILVLAVLVASDPYTDDLPGLNFITDNLYQIGNPAARNSTVVRGQPGAPVDLSLLLPSQGAPEAYFTYFGSLTTPLCNEAVTWVVVSRLLPVSEYQMEQFRQVVDKCGEPLSGNIRPLQRVNGRQIGYVE